jgi:hypothetical protein
MARMATPSTYAVKAWDESLHPREGGKFAPKNKPVAGGKPVGPTTAEMMAGMRVATPKAAAAAKKAVAEAAKKKRQAEAAAKKAARDKTAASKRAAAEAKRIANEAAAAARKAVADARGDEADKDRDARAANSERERRATAGETDDPAVAKARAEFDTASAALRDAEKAVEAASTPEQVRKAGEARRAAESRVVAARTTMRAAEKAAGETRKTQPKTTATPSTVEPVATPAAVTPAPTPAGTAPRTRVAPGIAASEPVAAAAAPTPPGQNSEYGAGTGSGWDWKPPAEAVQASGVLYEDAVPRESPGGASIVDFGADGRAVYGDGSAFTAEGWKKGAVTPEEVAQMRARRTERRAAVGLPPLPQDVETKHLPGAHPQKTHGGGETRQGIFRITFRAAVEGGGTRKSAATLRDPTFRTDPGGVTITGTEVDRDGRRTDSVTTILTEGPSDFTVTPLVTDLHTGRLTARESARSKRMRAAASS